MAQWVAILVVAKSKHFKSYFDRFLHCRSLGETTYPAQIFPKRALLFAIDTQLLLCATVYIFRFVFS